jgi:TPR repeat protein
MMFCGPLFAQPLSTQQMRSNAAGAYLKGDYKTALRLYTALAHQGDAEAALDLGLMYDKGKGVLQDGAKALKWYRLAADRGVDDAQVYIGILYYEGRGVPQDYEEAAKWFRRAVEQGYVGAQYHLGLMFYEGHGVHQNYVLAYMWLNLAASGLVPLDKSEVAEFLQKRDMVASRMNPEQIAEAQKLAREWKPTKK